MGSAQVERWMDGTAKDPIVRLEEELDEQRFLVDSEYQARPDVLEKVSRLVKLRHERDAKTPPPLPEGTPPGLATQQAYEQNREAVISDAKKAAIDREIDRLEERRGALDVLSALEGK